MSGTGLPRARWMFVRLQLTPFNKHVQFENSMHSDCCEFLVQSEESMHTDRCEFLVQFEKSIHTNSCEFLPA